MDLQDGGGTPASDEGALGKTVATHEGALCCRGCSVNPRTPGYGAVYVEGAVVILCAEARELLWNFRKDRYFAHMWKKNCIQNYAKLHTLKPQILLRILLMSV